MTAEEMERKSRGISTDMGSEAVLRRLQIVSQLNNLMRYLMKGKVAKLAPVEFSVRGDQRLPDQATAHMEAVTCRKSP